MKKSILISLFILSAIIIQASNTDVPKNPDGDSTQSTYVSYSNLIVQQIIAPYSLTQIVPMQKVISKDSYELWKCPSEFVNNYPGVNITGKSFHYFVYKNGKFHMTVNEMNKESVYKFFTDQI